MKKRIVSVIAFLLAIIMLLGLFITVLPGASAASSGEIRNQINILEAEATEIKKKKTELKSQIGEINDETSSLIEKKTAIDQEINITLEEINNTKALIAEYDNLIEEKEIAFNAAKQGEAELRDRYRARIRAMEESGSVSYLAILFSANSFSDLLDRLDWIQSISESDNKMLAEMSQAADAIQIAKDELDQTQALQAEKSTELEQEQALLEEQSARAEELIAEYSKQTDEMYEVEKEYDAMEADLYKRIAEKQREYEIQKNAEEEAARIAAAEKAAREAANNSGKSTGSGSGSGSSQKGGTSTSEVTPTNNKTTFIKPVNGPISSPFGMRMHPVYGYEKMHNGVDYAVGKGTPIKASASGTVTVASYNSSAGNWVQISHPNGYSTAYMHMTNYIVKVGQTVVQGQVIGYVGSTGCSTGPHLHFAVLKNGSYVNPVNYVG